MSKRVLDRRLANSSLQRISDRLFTGPRFLAYHSVSNRELFAAQLDLLTRRYHPVTPAEYVTAVAERLNFPPRAVLITFDDADYSLLEHALPVLQERRLSAVAFAVAGFLGTDQPFWWQEAEALYRNGGRTAAAPGARSSQELLRVLKQVPDESRKRALQDLRATATAPAQGTAHLRPDDLQTLEAGGIEIGNHSLTHPILSRCPAEKVRREVVEAHERLTALLGRPPRFFAYPNGNPDPRAEEALRDLGYRASFLFDHRRPEWPPPEPLRVSRLRVGSETSLDRFRLILSGLHPSIHRLLGRS